MSFAVLGVGLGGGLTGGAVPADASATQIVLPLSPAANGLVVAPGAASIHRAGAGTGTTGPPAGPALSILDMPTTAPPKVAAPRILGSKAQQVTGQETPNVPAGPNGTVFGSSVAPVVKSAVKSQATPFRAADGMPTALNPTLSIVAPGPVPVGVPNFFIDNFDVPPFLLPIFQAAGAAYDVPWQVLAAINQIETDYGRDLNVSSAGAEGWMQFLPQTWAKYGVDATGAGVEDPYNPADAIFAAARYLHAAGASTNLRGAIFAYNHADWYVKSVMLRAQLIGGLPANLLTSLSGLTEGLFPVDAAARYADNVVQAAASAATAGSPTVATTPAQPAQASGTSSTPVAPSSTATTTLTTVPDQSAIDIYARAGASVLAVKDGVVTAMGDSPKLGRYIKLRDVDGNTYTYGGLKKLAAVYAEPKQPSGTLAPTVRAASLPAGPAISGPASAGHQAAQPAAQSTAPTPATGQGPLATDTSNGPQRLFAYPARPASFAAGGSVQIAMAQPVNLSKYLTQADGLTAPEVQIEPLRTGSRVLAGAVLGRIGVTSSTQAPHVSFQIRPAGHGSPEIDPKPILDGWQLLKATASSGSTGSRALFGSAVDATLDEVLAESRAQLEQQVLADPSIVIYPDGRRLIEAGWVDQRVLAALEFLSASGLRPTVSALRAGSAPVVTAPAAGSPSGDATPAGALASGAVGAVAPDRAKTAPAIADATQVDISAINGIPVLDHQGAGSISDTAIRLLLSLPGEYQPEQIVSLTSYPADANTVAMPDHTDRISVAFAPSGGQSSAFGGLGAAVLTAPQWFDLTTRLDQLGEPAVQGVPSAAAIPDEPAAGSGVAP